MVAVAISSPSYRNNARMREQRIDRFFRPTLLTTNPAPKGQDVIPKETDVTGGETSRPSGDNANIEVHGTEVEPRAPEVGKQEPSSAVAQVQGSLSRHVIHILRTLHNVDEEAPVYDEVELEELERQLVIEEKYLSPQQRQAFGRSFGWNG